MASQRVQTQLSKQLEVNAPGTTPAGTGNAAPTIIQNPTQQQPFPTYTLGYNPLNNVPQVAQPIPARPANGQGSAHPFHMLSEDNLHAILFRLEAGPDTLGAVPVPTLVNQATGVVETGKSGRPLRYFSHLPRWIAADVPGMLLELWMRLDTRVDMADIQDRMNTPNKTARPGTLNMRRIRFREVVNVPRYVPGRLPPTMNEVELVGNLTREQILLNTSMVVDVAGNRLLQPRLVNGKTVLGYVDSGLPLDHFIADYSQPIPIPSSHMVVVVELRKRLQTLAQRRGLGNTVTDYKRLSRDLMPSWWNKNEDARPITDLDGKSHEAFIGELLGRLGTGAGAGPVARRGRRAAPRPTAAAAAATTTATTAAVTAPAPAPAPAAASGALLPLPALPPQTYQNAAAFFPRPSQASAASVTPVGASGVGAGALAGFSAAPTVSGQQQYPVPTSSAAASYAATATANTSQAGAGHGNLSGPGTGTGTAGSGAARDDEEDERAAQVLGQFMASGQGEDDT